MTKGRERRPLPEFTNPPVIEVALSTAYDPLPQYTSAHAGLFWSRIADRFVNAQEHPPLVIPAATEDRESDALQQPQFRLIGRLPFPRVWLLNKDESELLQIQPDSFIRNWRQTQQQKYPRYQRLRSEFERDFKEFVSFSESNGLGTPAPSRCEVTYVNHIVGGDGWTTFSEIYKVVKGCSELSDMQFLPDPEDRRCAANYAMRDNSGQFLGRLSITAEPAFRRADMQPLISVTLTARGGPRSGDVAGVLAFFDVAHEWIVQGFTDMTTEEMHRKWGRTQ